MEAFVGLIMVIATVAFLIFFKGMIKKTSKYTEDVVTTNIAENQFDLIRRSQEAYAKLEAEFGDDFMTPQQVYNRMMRRKKKESTENEKKTTKK